MAEASIADSRRSVSPNAAGAFGSGSAAAIVIGAIGVASVVAVLLPGVQNDAGRFVWYRRLDKPRLTPPDPVFGIAWPIIEVALAYGGWRLLQRPRTARRDHALGLLAFNVAMIPGYQALFFTARSITGGFAAAAALAMGAWSYVASSWREDRPASLAGVPLALWTSFATYLMVEVWRRNSTAAP